MLRWVVLLFCALALGHAGRASALPPPAALTLMGATEELEAGRHAFDVPGMAVVVVAEGRVALARGFGRLGIDNPTLVDADTRFSLASCTKAFTAFDIALLVEDGALRFDDLVAKIDPDLRLPDPTALDRLTVADLLSQRSGLARHDFLWHANPHMTRAAFATAQGSLAMQYAPGQRYGYTNSAFILAGRLVDLQAGEPWEAFTKRRVFGPLGMTRTNFSSEGLAEDANAARATKRSGGESRTVPWRDSRLLGPAGSINSTANDMGRWLLMLAGGGAIGEKRLIAKSTLEQMWRPAGVASDEEGSAGYAYGWRVDVWRGYRRISHSGAVDGFRARVVVFPELGVGIAVMANLGPTQLPEFASRVLAERVLGLERRTDLVALGEGRRLSEQRAARAAAPTPPGRIRRMGPRAVAMPGQDVLAAYVGVYEHPAYGEIRIGPPLVAGSAPRIKFGQLEGRLDHWNGDGFIARSDWPDDTLDESEIIFVADEAGAVTGLTAMIDNDIPPIFFLRLGGAEEVLRREASARLTSLPSPPAPANPAPLAVISLLCWLAAASGVAWRLSSDARADR